MFITAKRSGNLECSVPAVFGRSSIPGALCMFLSISQMLVLEKDSPSAHWPVSTDVF